MDVHRRAIEAGEFEAGKVFVKGIHQIFQHGDGHLFTQANAGGGIAPVMDASKKSTATPFLGVSPIVRLNGAPLLTVMGFMELQAKSPPTAKRTATGKSIRFIEKPPWTKPIGNQAGLGAGSSVQPFHFFSNFWAKNGCLGPASIPLPHRPFVVFRCSYRYFILLTSDKLAKGTQLAIAGVNEAEILFALLKQQRTRETLR